MSTKAVRDRGELRPTLEQKLDILPRDMVPALDAMLTVAGRSPVEAAVAVRMMRDITRLTDGLGEDALSDVLSAQSDHLALLRIVMRAEAISVGDVREATQKPSEQRAGWDIGRSDPSSSRSSDQMAIARLAGIAARQELLDMGGGAYGGEELARLLGISRQAVDNRRKKKKLLALTLGKRGYVYPVWQILDGEVLTGLGTVLDTLAEFDPWSQMVFVLNPNTWLGYEAPIDLLRRGAVDEVREAASVFGEQVAS